MDIVVLIIFIIALFISAKIVNGAYRAYMRAVGADWMNFNGGKKLFVIVLVALCITGVIMNLFGM